MYPFRSSSSKARSYPTYEEWKPQSFIGVLIPSTGSYPTYEEWKLYRQSEVCDFRKRSYPTYEEWKLLGPCVFSFSSFLFLSYL